MFKASLHIPLTAPQARRSPASRANAVNSVIAVLLVLAIAATVLVLTGTFAGGSNPTAGSSQRNAATQPYYRNGDGHGRYSHGGARS